MMADKNGDGQLDPAEVNASVVDAGRAAVQTAFNVADLDKNGAVSQAEFDKAIINPAHVLFRIFDANNDNQISHDEMRSGMQILRGEMRQLRVPEPGNSIPNQISAKTPPRRHRPSSLRLRPRSWRRARLSFRSAECEVVQHRTLEKTRSGPDAPTPPREVAHTGPALLNPHSHVFF